MADVDRGSHCAEKHEFCLFAKQCTCNGMILLSLETDSRDRREVIDTWVNLLTTVLEGIPFTFGGCCLDMSPGSTLKKRFKWNIFVKILSYTLEVQDEAKRRLDSDVIQFLEDVRRLSLCCNVQLLKAFYFYPDMDNITLFGNKKFVNELMSIWNLLVKVSFNNFKIF